MTQQAGRRRDVDMRARREADEEWLPEDLAKIAEVNTSSNAVPVLCMYIIINFFNAVTRRCI